MKRTADNLGIGVIERSRRLAFGAHHISKSLDELAPPIVVEDTDEPTQFFPPYGEERFGLCDAIPRQSELARPEWDAIRLSRTFLESLRK